MERWDAERLLQGRTFEDCLQELDAAVDRFSRWKDRLAALSQEEFKELLGEYRALEDMQSRVYGYAHLNADADASDATNRARLSSARDALSKVRNRMRFFTHWWKTADDATIDRLAPVLGPDRYVFMHMRALREHMLPVEQENLISIKDTTGVAALNTIHDMIDSRMTYLIDSRSLTGDEVRSLFSDADPAARRSAYQAFFSTRSAERDVLAEIYRNIVLDWEHERELRGYPTPITIRNKGNDLPDEVVAAHLEACRKAAPLWQRYFRIKATLLGYPLTRYDIYAPLPQGEREYSYEEAVRMTLDALGRFSPRLRSAAEEIYAGGFVDAFPRKHKRGGAFCWGITPDLPPYLLYNFAGKLRDVTTVAHETGHGVHAQLGRQHTPLSWGHALPIAETASVFSELLLTQELMQDPSLKKAVLVQQLSDMYATIGRQSFFVLFEMRAHELIRNGATADEIDREYLETLKEQFGDMELPPEFKDEWLAIPHFFHTPFYCYAYSFGNLLTLALYEQYRKEGAAFVPKYEAFLAAAETRSPIELCAMLGVDITDSRFWHQGFAVIERMLDALERLAH